jgi:succinate-semialdehyde dehydrogenase/glutarate-semialdehyde dehydrogenase
MNNTATLNLKDPDLLRQAMLIDGEWVQAESGLTIEVRNPATGELVARVPNGGESETRRAIAAAERAMQGWRKTLAKERAKILR